MKVSIYTYKYFTLMVYSLSELAPCVFHQCHSFMSMLSLSPLFLMSWVSYSMVPTHLHQIPCQSVYIQLLFWVLSMNMWCFSHVHCFGFPLLVPIFPSWIFSPIMDLEHSCKGSFSCYS